ncbi:MAG: OmpA family protein [Bacteroidales bacterium]|nr:OmpA family protein [Bacteroidales bacterium]
MKYSILFSAVMAFLFLLPQEAKPQKVKVNVKEKVVEETDNRANRKTDEIIDAGFDKIEEGIGSVFRKKDKKSAKETEADTEGNDTGEERSADRGKKAAGSGNEQEQLALKWNKYDFVPGDKLIFEDNQEDEQNGEFPSRWDHAGGGSVENVNFGETPGIWFKDEDTWIVPFMKEPDRDYLPEIFTVEFDAWFENEEYCQYYLEWYDMKNQDDIGYELRKLQLKPNEVSIYGVGEAFYPGEDYEYNVEEDESFWRHIAISFNKRALKVYFDDARVLNIPNANANPTGISISGGPFNTAGIKGINRFIKNIRIAEGGVKLYDKFLSEGKIIANGIRFDVNKATIKPESMGVINEIVKLMKDHPEISFSVEGHTDSDGETAFNQSLSEKRAEAVAAEMVRLGIDKSRLTSKGFGESAPIDTNTTPEGKANNRRVEFVKI